MADNKGSRKTTTRLSAFKSGSAYPVLYMFLVTFFFTLILVGLGALTRERVEANKQVMFERAVLMSVFPDRITDKTPPSEVHSMFVEVARKEGEKSYLIEENGELFAYAVPIAGKGFWDVIKGVIGIGPDKQTVAGIAFYEQNETPGLGAEITKPFFRKRFEGLQIAAGSERPVDIVVGTETDAPNQVLAITGATQTCTRLEIVINDSLKEWLSSGEPSKESP